MSRGCRLALPVVQSSIITVLLGPMGISPDILQLFFYAVPFRIASLVICRNLSKKHSTEVFRKTIYFLVGCFGGIAVVKVAISLLLQT